MKYTKSTFMLISANKRNNFRDFILILFRFEDVAVS